MVGLGNKKVWGNRKKTELDFRRNLLASRSEIKSILSEISSSMSISQEAEAKIYN